MQKNTGSRRKNGVSGRTGAPMDAQKVSAALRELAAEHAGTPRSETARLREVLDDVEAALSAGATHAAVLAILHAQGFTLTACGFQSTLARLRRERKAGQGNVHLRNDAEPG
jgi:hypothetical protein